CAFPAHPSDNAPVEPARSVPTHESWHRHNWYRVAAQAAAGVSVSGHPAERRGAPQRFALDHHDTTESTMQIQISGHQIEITQALRDHVQNRLNKLDKYFDNVTSLAVVLSVEKLVHRAEATLAVSGRTLHAEASDGDMYASIDTLLDKLVAQLRKYKEKLTAHHREEGRELRAE
ncbi:ribosomal subunit interface protein, partial [mine drainage metagenome]